MALLLAAEALLLAEDVAEDGQVVVHDLDRHDMNVAYLEGFVLVDFVQLDSGNARIAVFGKAVRQGLQHGLARQGVGIDIDFAKLAVGPDIVHAAYVVVVGMGDEDAVNLAEGLRHDLLAKVGTAINEQPRGLRLDQCRTAQALVVDVGTAASVALATDSRYAARCSRSKKCQFHLLLK